MIAFHDCYYAAVFLAGVRWPTKILERVQYFRRLVEPTKISIIIFVGLRDRRNKLYRFRRLDGLTKIRCTVSSASLADENAFIFVDFIPSAYFRRPTDENTYFRWFLGYFR
jgi:hypothetical protein